ncbi:MAG TPA: dihydrolipoamide acetyltransferase family protein [Dehalococcoidia bacterium]|nr:dihydrolipoamide acetyltransferase family protein [Dehalococcoidia bacterium]
MATEVLMPKLGMTMVEGTLAAWLQPDGAPVAPGVPIFRMTTEKIDYEVEAEAEGVLRHAAAEEAVIEAGGLVGYILATGEAPPAGLGAGPAPAGVVTTATPAARANGSAAPATAPDSFVVATPAARRLARELGVDLAAVHGSGPGGRVSEADVTAAHQSAAAVAADTGEVAAGVKASPLARRIAEQHGIDLRTLHGSGPGGRIVQEDVEGAIAAAAGGAAAPVASVPYRGLRKTIGERMHASLQQMAQLTLTAEADVTDLLKLRGQLVEEWERDGVRVGFTDLAIKAAARALREHPRVNASLEGDQIVLHAEVNVGMAVALAEGLIVPVLHRADVTPLKQLAERAAALAERARAGKLGFDDVSGGTFSVTSLGMYGVDGFTPIVNPPQAAILGVGRIRDALALEGSEVRRRSVMTLSLTIDHRVLDGAPAAEFLARIRHLLERPYLLLAE